MKKASELEQTKGRVLLAFGPVGVGKTNLLLGQPTPHLVLACDTGNITIPPGINKDEVYIEEFHVATREFNAMGRTTPLRDVYTATVKRLHEIYTALAAGQPLRVDNRAEELPPLASISLDGLYSLNQMLVDGQCVLNNVNEPGEMGNKTMKFWGSRLLAIMTIMRQFAGLNLNVGMSTWEEIEKDKEGNVTGRIYPAIGGKMDVIGAGLADAVLYCYSRTGRYYVRTRSDGMIQGCKVRNQFNLPETLDVTMDPKDMSLPYTRIWK